MTEDAPLEPIPATAEAFGLLAGEDIERDVRQLAAHVRAVVPETVGVSLSLREPGMTFTFAVRDRWPRPDDPQHHDDVTGTVEVLDEEQWSASARASAHAGVRSSLSVPAHLHDEVVGALDVYAATRDAFVGHEAAVAALVHAPAAEVVRDADLSFSTRTRAEETKRAVAEGRVVDLAAGILAAREEITVADAAVHLRAAAGLAGVPLLELARLVVDLR